MTDLPIVMTAAGRQNTDPATLRAALVALVAAQNPGYTANLPGSLIEDIASTDVGALVTCDQALTELINSITPYGANLFLLQQLGNIYGVTQGSTTNTSVFVVFSGTVGFIIQRGFIVGDGTHQYIVQDGGVIASGGSSIPLYCLAVGAGSWPVPTGTVTTIASSIPGGITLTVTNPNTGIPSTGAQTEADYRAQVIQAGLASSTGMATMLKTALSRVLGVQSRLIAVQQQSPGWKVLVGGGDPYDVGFAIYSSMFDVSNLVGSVMTISAITKANPGVVTTTLNHGLITGNTTSIAGAVGMTAANGGPYTVTVLTEKTFSFGVDTTGFGTYTANSGHLTPNPRNVTVNVIDYPDTYTVAFVVPPQQSVTISLTWNGISPYIVANSAVQQLAAPAIASYINSIPVGSPINEFELNSVFQQSISSLIQIQYLTRIVWTVSINGVSTSVSSGTGIVVGDPESYFYCTSSDITVTQG